MVKQIIQEAKIEWKFNNHSMLATGATALFNVNVPEAIIQKRSGAFIHQSLTNVQASHSTPRPGSVKNTAEWEEAVI